MAKPFSLLLNTISMIAGFGALIAAAWAGYTALVVLLGLALAVALVTRVWSRLSLKGVACERRLSERRVFPDEEVLLHLRVVNRKILPLAWVEVRDEIPARLVNSQTATPESNAASGTGIEGDTRTELLDRPGFVSLSRSTPMLWYSAATFTQRLDSSTRGYYPLGPLSVTSGDIFGLYPRSLVHPDTDHLVVYPRTYTLAELGIPALSHLGDTRSELRLFDDPSRLMGVREYAPGDSPRRIHWKASARSRALQVKLFESTTELKVAVFLAVDTFDGLSQDDLELGISTAASVARHLIERDVQTGIFVNTKLADTHQSARVPAGSGVTQLALVLEALAKTTAEPESPFIDFFERQRGGLGFGGTLVFVTGRVPPEMGLLLTDLRRAGRRVLGFYLDPRGPESRAPGVSWHRVDRPPARSSDVAAGVESPPSPPEAAVA